MQVDLSQYKIIKRKTVLLWLCVVFFIGLILVWFAQEYMAQYIQRQKLLAEQDYAAAALQSLALLRIVIYITAAFAFATGLYVFRYGYRSKKTTSITTCSG